MITTKVRIIVTSKGEGELCLGRSLEGFWKVSKTPLTGLVDCLQGSFFDNYSTQLPSMFKVYFMKKLN